MTRLSAAALLASAASLFSCPAWAAPALQPDLTSLQAVPRVELPVAAVQKALEQPVKGRPYQFAVPVDLTLETAHGLWLTRGDTAGWRLRLHSQGARSLGLKLNHPMLPAGTELWVYDPRAQLVLGPYDATSVTDGGLWIPTVGGDEVVLEIRGPAASAARVELGAAQAFHGFRDWKDGTGKSAAACNVNVVCHASEWGQDADSVALITINDIWFCSGQLLNNVEQSALEPAKRGLFLTANHCGIDGDSGPASSVMFYFGYENAQCTGGVSNPLPAPTFQRSTRLAHDIQSDFTLLLITNFQALPSLYFAGWDATGTGASSGVAIHHPSGDEKKISILSGAVSRSTVNIGAACAIDAWRTQWSSGTTEGGSSGGGLWNEAHQLIGALSGGTASCSNPSGDDYFGRLDRAWTANTSASGQLKAHLDPGNTCIAAVPGLAATSTDGALTDGPRVCAGPASTCSGRRKGGGSLDWLTLLVLGALSATRPGTRRRPPPPSPPAARV